MIGRMATTHYRSMSQQDILILKCTPTQSFYVCKITSINIAKNFTKLLGADFPNFVPSKLSLIDATKVHENMGGYGITNLTKHGTISFTFEYLPTNTAMFHFTTLPPNNSFVTGKKSSGPVPKQRTAPQKTTTAYVPHYRHVPITAGHTNSILSLRKT